MPKSQDLAEVLIVDALNRMDGKLDKLDDRLDNVGQTLVRQQASLDEHIKRTNLLETKIEADASALKVKLEKDVENLLASKRQKSLMLGLKILGGVAATGGGGVLIKNLVAAILKIWSP